jgi:hypothetical protein
VSISRRATRPKPPRRMLKALVTADVSDRQVARSAVPGSRITRIAGDGYVSAGK